MHKRNYLRSLVLVVVLVGLLAGSAAAAGNELIVGRSADAGTYDPHQSTSLHTGYVSQLLGDNLVALDYDMHTIVPALAESWEISEDGLTYTFKLKKGVKFHSGREVTAEDWKFTFERWVDPELASPSSWRLGPVESFVAEDDYTFVINLSKPYSEFLLQLTSPFAIVLNPEVVEEYGEAFGIQYMSGTGPFKWGDWVRNQYFVVERNADYNWGPEFLDNQGPAYVEKLEFRVIPEDTTRMLQLENGDLDLVLEVPAHEVESLQAKEGIEIVFTEPYLWTDYVGFKVNKPLISDPRVRRAMNYAVNKQQLIDIAEQGLADPADNIAVAGTPGYWEGAEAIWPDYDLEKARELLTEAGWVDEDGDGVREKDGQELAPIFFSISPWHKFNTLLQAQLKMAGIDMQVKEMEVGVLFDLLRTDQYDMYRMNGSYASVLDVVSEYFHSSNMPAPNRMNWDDPRTDELIETARATTDTEKRNELLKEIQKIVAENYLWIPVFNKKQYSAVRTGVEGYRPHGLYGSFLYKLTDVKLSE